MKKFSGVKHDKFADWFDAFEALEEYLESLDTRRKKWYSEFRITEAYEQLLRQRLELFQSTTKTKFSLVITFVTTYGVADGLHHSLVHSEVTMEQLFK